MTFHYVNDRLSNVARRRKLRVLTLIEKVTAHGGAERLAAQVAIRLDPDRFDRTICATWHVEEPPVAEARAAGVRVVCLGRRRRTSLRPWWRLLSILRDERIDVLHAHLSGSNLWGTLLGRLARVPVIVAHEHGWAHCSAIDATLRRLLDRHVIARGADVVLAVSRENRRQMIETAGVDPDIVRLIPSGIPPLPRLSGRNIRSELGIAPEAPVIGAVGGLRTEKSLDVLIRAAAILAPDFWDLAVLIAGGGTERLRLEALIRENGLEKTVILLGPRSDVSDILAAVDVAVSSSDTEGSPLAVMEYMAAGKPVVTTQVGGIPELVEHNVTGLLVDRRDAEGLASAISELLRDPSRRQVMGARGRERQRHEFDIDFMVRRLEELYEQLYLGSPRGQPPLRLFER